MFAIRDVSSGKMLRSDDGGELYFSTKAAAKVVRDQVSYDTGRRHAVVLGPDHKRAKASQGESE